MHPWMGLLQKTQQFYSSVWNFFIYVIYVFVSVYMHMCKHGPVGHGVCVFVCGEGRGQHVRVGSLLPPSRVRGMNSGL